jgi:hypothetical protein
LKGHRLPLLIETAQHYRPLRFSVVPLKGDLVYLPIFPAVKTAGYFHSSGYRRTGIISGNQFKSASSALSF